MGATGGRLIGNISLSFKYCVIKTDNNSHLVLFFTGEFLLWALPHSGVIPGGYAVVGAAAMSAGVTRTLSTSIIVFEMTGQLELLIPVLVCFYLFLDIIFIIITTII